MKAILFAASAIGLLAATPAYAAEKTITVSGTVAGACGLGNHKSGAESAPNWTQGDIALGAMTGADGKLAVSPVTRSFGNVWCNGPAVVTIDVSKLTNSSVSAPVDSSSFTNTFDMKISGDLGGTAFGNSAGNLVVSSADGQKVINTNGPFETGLQRYSSFTLEVLNPNNLRPAAGSYAGTIKLTATVNS